ncbi:MAG TPA: epimerase [Rheinheimera sp.]|nr:epimerase [Rheinheimera sp.]
MTINVLVTGGAGFLAINTAKFFKAQAASVFGIGRSKDDSDLECYDRWIESSVTCKALLEFDVRFDLVVHCGGGSSVGYAQENPLEDFYKTVAGVAELLEFVKKNNPEAHVIYPSSPAVHGQQPDVPIDEDDEIKPVSVYGYHKEMAENLLICGHKLFGLKVSIIRFYSIYGVGLKKQLLWDACKKIVSSPSAVFWGDGNETRDWIHVDDAVGLIHFLFTISEPPLVVNGGGGASMTVRCVIELLERYLGVPPSSSFNGSAKAGDPKYYCAGQRVLKGLGWSPKVSIQDGLFDYVEWFKKNYG